MKASVKTNKEAVAVLQDWLNRNLTDDNMQADTYIRPCSTRCACGETPGMEAFYEAGDKIARVAVCEGCTDATTFDDDVIEII